MPADKQRTLFVPSFSSVLKGLSPLTSPCCDQRNDQNVRKPSPCRRANPPDLNAAHRAAPGAAKNPRLSGKSGTLGGQAPWTSSSRRKERRKKEGFSRERGMVRYKLEPSCSPKHWAYKCRSLGKSQRWSAIKPGCLLCRERSCLLPGGRSVSPVLSLFQCNGSSNLGD